jgi:hypothetical protein
MNREKAVTAHVMTNDPTLWNAESEDELALNRYPLLYPADEYECDNLHSSLFSLPELRQPNLGWIRSRNGHAAVNLQVWAENYGLAYCDLACWEWGDVLWDSERLVRWKAPTLQEWNREQQSYVILTVGELI